MPASVRWILQNLRRYAPTHPATYLERFLLAFVCNTPLIWVLFAATSLAVPCCLTFSNKSAVKKCELTVRMWALTGTLYSTQLISQITFLRCNELIRHIIYRRLSCQKKLILQTYRKAPLRNSYLDNLNRAILMRAALRAYRQLEEEAEILLITNELHDVLPEFPSILNRLERYVKESSGGLVQAIKELKKGEDS